MFFLKKFFIGFFVALAIICAVGAVVTGAYHGLVFAYGVFYYLVHPYVNDAWEARFIFALGIFVCFVSAFCGFFHWWDSKYNRQKDDYYDKHSPLK